MIAELILIPASETATESGKQCAQYVARGLSAIGIKVREHISLCTNKVELQKAIATALGRSNVVVSLGGLSKQQNYLAKTVISKGLGLALAENAVCLDAIRNYCSKTGETFGRDDQSYAMLPQGSVAFPGQYGKIPGFAISSAKQHIILMPDAQTEAAAMLNKYISPYLSGTESKATVTRTIRTYGIGEEQVRAVLCELLDTANPAVTVDKENGEVLVRVSAHATGTQEAATMCTPVLRELVERLGDSAYGLDVDSLESAIVGKLRKKHLDIAIAEAGCDGMLTRVITETSGGAEVLRYSTVADSNEAKTEKLQLNAKLLKKKGGVCEEVAVAMAYGAQQRADSTLGIAICANTTDEKRKKCPIGLVYIAVCDVNTVYVKKLVVGSGDPMERDLVIDAAVSRSLNMIRLFVDYLPGAYTASIPLDEALAGRTVTDQDNYVQDGPAGSSRKKQGFFARFADNFIIRKADETSVKVKKVIFILAVLVFLGSGGYVGKYYYDSFKAARQATQLQEIFSFGEMGDVEMADNYPKDYLPAFAGLWNINEDVVAYLNIPDTQIQYPIVQGPDNDYYLRRDFYENRNEHGIPFMDYKVNVKKPSDNMVVYGHNMRDGQIFNELIPYQELEYYREHPIIEFSTIHDSSKYKIFSIFITNGRSEQGEVFEYHNFIDAKSDQDFAGFANQLRIRSLLNIPVDVEPGDKLLTLSTCTYEFSEARFVVVARRLRKGEDPSVDTALAEKNKQPLYPDIWYKTFGGSKPIGLDSASVVTSPTTNRPPSSSELEFEDADSASDELEPVLSSSSSRVSSSSRPISSSAPPASSSSAPAPSSSSAPPPSSSSEDESDDEIDPSAATQSQSSSSDESSSSSRGQDDLVFTEGSSSSATSSDSGNRSVDEDGININFAARASTSTVQIRPISSNEPSIFDGMDIDPRKSSDNIPTGGGLDSSFDGSGYTQSYTGQLTVLAGGQKITDDAVEIISRIVQSEMGTNFQIEAVKAQAIAAYTYIVHHTNKGQTSTVVLSAPSAVSTRVRDAVKEVIGRGIYYNDAMAFTPYHATSAGQTTSSAAVWGGSYPYLVPVDSTVDKQAAKYRVAWTFSSDDISSKISNKLGIETWGDPMNWFEILTITDGGYNGQMAVCGETKSKKTGATITGRVLRENVLGLRSACFSIDYDDASDLFTFTTFGYGHGVGMSQNGANFYAQDGWNYKQILEHYYPGCAVR